MISSINRHALFFEVGEGIKKGKQQKGEYQ